MPDWGVTSVAAVEDEACYIALQAGLTTSSCIQEWAKQKHCMRPFTVNLHPAVAMHSGRLHGLEVTPATPMFHTDTTITLIW